MLIDLRADAVDGANRPVVAGTRLQNVRWYGHLGGGCLDAEDDPLPNPPYRLEQEQTC